MGFYDLPVFALLMFLMFARLLSLVNFKALENKI